MRLATMSNWPAFSCTQYLQIPRLVMEGRSGKWEVEVFYESTLHHDVTPGLNVPSQIDI